MGRRTKARECAMQMLYEWEMTRAPLDEVMVSFWRLRSTADATRERAEALVRGTHAALPEIDAAIARAATRWRMERIGAVERAILRVGAFELIGAPATPAAVVIDEAVELSKRFAEAEAFSFVNGVLDAVRRAVRSGTEPARGHD